MASLTKHLICFALIFVLVDGQCNTGIYVHKTHQWNKGYVGKMFFDQSWLTMETSEWKLNIAFTNQVAEFKIWDADIINPATSMPQVYNVTMVEIMNKCWNPHLYPCQYLDLQFLVRFPAATDVSTTMYDIVSGTTENVSYKDGTTGTASYCAPMDGEPPGTAGTTTAAPVGK